mmetsp:Transcript_6782/g.11064  ORF Transcript_6782/g.11064 Transcript_6782/m.11064 type:complete len:1348 (+) Transcript_6782:228-4271(+)
MSPPKQSTKNLTSTTKHHLLKSSYLEQYNSVRGTALPLSRAANFDDFLRYFRCANPKYNPNNQQVAKVGLWSLLSYSTPQERLWMVLGIIMATFTGLGIPAWLILLARSLDTFSSLATLMAKAGENVDLFELLRSELNKLCIAFAIVGAVCLVTGFIYVSIWTYTGEQQSLRIQKQFVRSCLNQDAEWYDSNDREALPTKMGTALVHVSNAIGRQVVDVYANAVSALGCLIVALLLNTPLSLVMLCVVPIAILIMALFNICIRRVKKRANSELANAGGVATEVLAGIKTVAALCAQPHFTDKYETHVRTSAKASVTAAFLSSLLAGITGALFYATYTIAFYIGTEQVQADSGRMNIIYCFFSDETQCRVTGASVMCCIYGVILCVTFFGLMGPGLSVINLGRSAAVDVFNTLNRTPVIDPASNRGKTIPDGLKGKIQFKDLYFTYGNTGRPLFFNFNLTIEPGQSVALVGPSGSGKSTIAKFIMRFYDIDEGEIVIDDHYPLTTLNVAWWRSQIGYVAQEPILFPGTIRDNIALGKPSSEGAATEEEIRNAAEMACAHDFIVDLPNGYDTYYGGSSVQLSGGQMQRICIARALLRNPKILVLDEATSALDQVSEEHVQAALKNIREKKRVTTVTIAHRLTTIIDSDAIAVIANGKIAELGSHETLLNKEDGIYRLLCESQGIKPGEHIDSSVGREVDNSVDAKGGDVEKGGGSTENQLASSAVVEVEMGASEGANDVTEELDDDIDLKQIVEVASMSSIWKYVGWDGVYTAIGVIGSGIVGCLSPCESILTAEIVTTFYTVDQKEMLERNLRFISFFLIFAIASLVGNVMVGTGLSRSGSNLGARLRSTSFRSMLKKSMGWFDENTVGELTTVLGADVEAAEGLVGLPLGFRIRVLSSLVTGVCVALAYSWKIGLVALACVPFIGAAGVLQVCCTTKKSEYEPGGLSPATILEQGLRGITSVQAYNLEPKVGDDYDTALVPESKGKVREGLITGAVFGFSQMAVFVSFAVVFFVGSLLLVNGDIAFVNFFTAVLSVMFGALGASQVSADFNSRQKGLISAARIFSTFDGPTDGSEYETGEKSATIKGAIKFSSVEFSYPTRPDSPIFYKSAANDGVSFDLGEKKSIGLVGRSGSGKSTILQIVMRFYEISGGSATVDGTEFSDMNVNNLRRQIGYVGQMPILFNTTVRNNILLGKPDATEEEVVAAAKAAHAHNFIMNLSEGYDTELGPSGGLLSGGQKQRIAIARGIISNPQILVLDEATAALDNESQKLVQAALDELQATNPRTTLTVAHRLMTIKDCDKIAFLGDGGVLEMGKHSELLALKGHYYNLWIMQGSEEELEEKKKTA